MDRIKILNSRGEIFSLLSSSDSQSSTLSILFFHATGFNAQTYIQLLEKLNKKFNQDINILALDQRGHGMSSAESIPKKLSSWHPYFEDAIEICDQISGPLICMGHSMGAIVAARLTEMRQKKVSKLVMIEPVLAGPYESLRHRVLTKLHLRNKVPIASGAARRRSKFQDIDDAVNSYIGRGAFTTWDRSWIEDYVLGGTKKIETGEIELTCPPDWESKTFLTSAFDSWKHLKNIKIPSLALGGNINSTFSKQARKAFLKLREDWQLENFEGSSHFLPMERTEVVVDQIYEFVSK